MLSAAVSDLNIIFKSLSLSLHLESNCADTCGANSYCFGFIYDKGNYTCSCFAGLVKNSTGIGCIQPCNISSDCGGHSHCVNNTCACNTGYYSPSSTGSNCFVIPSKHGFPKIIDLLNRLQYAL